MPKGRSFGIDEAETSAVAGVIGLWRYEVESQLVFCNEPMAEFFGLPKTERSQGIPLWRVRQALCPADVAAANLNLEWAIRTGTNYSANYRVMRDGQAFWVASRGKPELDSNGQAINFHGVNLLAAAGCPDPFDKMADLAVETLAAARLAGDAMAVYFAEMLVVHIGSLVANRLRRDGAWGQQMT